MKNFIILTLLAVLVSACSTFQSRQNPAPNVDTQATIDALVRQSAAQTQAAQPAPTTAPPTDTATLVVASSPTSETTNDTPSPTPAPNLTTTPATATAGTLDPTRTTTQPASVSDGPTLTPTLGILTYGTLPPAVPSANITIYNKSKVQAYISLQNDPPHQIAILEYPVKKSVNVRAPLGYYDYVVWVGGKQIVGHFVLQKGDELTITIYKDKVVVQEP